MLKEHLRDVGIAQLGGQLIDVVVTDSEITAECVLAVVSLGDDWMNRAANVAEAGERTRSEVAASLPL